MFEDLEPMWREKKMAYLFQPVHFYRKCSKMHVFDVYHKNEHSFRPFREAVWNWRKSNEAL